MNIQVALIEDHVSIREMLAAMLVREGRYEVVGEAASGFEGLKMCRQVKPHLVILDLLLPELNGLEILRALRLDLPATRLLVYSGAVSRETVVDALRARPHGFVHKSERLPVLLEALRTVSAGGTYLTPFATLMLDRDRGSVEERSSLTPRERMI